MGSVAKASGFPPLGAHGVSPRRPKLWLIDIIPVKKTYLAFFWFNQPFQAAPAPITASLAGWMANPSTVTHQTVSVGPMGLAAGNAGTCIF